MSRTFHGKDTECDFGATNLTFKVGRGSGWFQKKKIHYLQFDREQSFQTLRQWKLMPHRFLLLWVLAACDNIVEWR